MTTPIDRLGLPLDAKWWRVLAPKPIARLHCRGLTYFLKTCYVSLSGETMSIVTRFGISLEDDLLQAFDRSIGGQGYQNRSEAIRDLIRDHLIQRKVGQGDEEVVGVITLLYDHRTHHLSDLLAEMQHKASVMVNASLHIHLDVHNCLEVIVVRGSGNKVHEVAGKLIATKGVQNGKLITTTPEMKH
jgi:CopG family transcriptional regulator, nickel-responsive regulator